MIIGYEKHKRIMTLVILGVSLLTLLLPKEVFDPHIGIDLDIFCKSLDAIGDSIEIPLLFHNEYLKIEIEWIFFRNFLSRVSCQKIPIRAPPSLPQNISV